MTSDVDETAKALESERGPQGRRMAIAISAVAFAWTLFQLWIASPLPFLLNFGIIIDVPARSIHLAFGLLLCFLTFPAARRMADKPMPAFDMVLAALGAACTLYLFLGHDGLVARRGVLLAYDVSLFGFDFLFPFEAILGGIAIAILLEATRRSIGLPLVIVAAAFLTYSIFGQSMPEIISHKGLSLTRLTGYQWLGGEAIFGIPLGVSVSFVFLFVLFGALLERAGAGRYFLDLAFALVGQFRGGPAKAAILASGITGMISGSSIANVVTTGTFTIPVMRKTGMPAVKAGAIEVAASVNGQIMPPIMGAAAFVIAEFLGISYFDVIVAAFLPATIAYIALFYISHLESMKLGLRGLPKAEIPPLGRTFWNGIHFLIPVGVLIYLLMLERWSTSRSVFWAIVALMLVIIAARIHAGSLNRRQTIVAYGLPIIAFAALRQWGLEVGAAIFWSAATAVIVILGNGLYRALSGANVWADARGAVDDIFIGMVRGARNMVGIAVAVAAAGIIVGAVNSTGLNNAMVSVVEVISGGNVYILLALTAVLCLILGMGLPTTANYLVVAALLAGVVVELGNAAGLVLPLIAVHLYVFYFGLMADVTPPVCLAAYAAAAISRADPLRTGAQAFLYEIRTAILPVVFIFNTELLLIGVESFWHGLMVFVVSLTAILAFSCITQRWMLVRLKLHEMALLAVVVVSMFRPDFVLDQFYPAYRSQDLAAFASGVTAVEPGRLIRFHVVRKTLYGDRFKLFVIDTPEAGAVTQLPPYGVQLVPADEGRYAVSGLAFGGPAEQIGVKRDDLITDVDVEQLDRPPKELIYPFALAVLGLVIGLQYARRRRTDAAITTAAAD